MSDIKEPKRYTIPKDSFNKAFLPYLRSNARIEIHYGGGGSGKSYFLAQRDILELLGKEENNILVMRKVAASNHNTTFSDYCHVIDLWDRKYIPGLSKYFRINHSKGDERILCLKTGNEVLFGGCKDDNELEKVKGIRATKGPITRLRLEELPEFTERDFNQLHGVRMRGETKTRKRTVCSMNPINAQSWIKKRFFDNAEKDTIFYEHENTNAKALMNNPNIVILKTTHEDNRFYGDEERRELLKFKDIDKYYYDVYVLGNWGVLGNIVFHNYVIEDFDYNENDLENVFTGMDYGFVHASTIERGGFREDELYIFDEVYGKGWTNQDFINETKDHFGDNSTIYDYMINADSAEPDRIEEWNRNGFKVEAAKKGPGSLKYGIDYLASIPKIHIHRTKCPNLAREIQTFKRKEDKDGNAIDAFVEINDDTISACLSGDTIVNTNIGNIKIKDLIGKSGIVKSFNGADYCESNFGDVSLTRRAQIVYTIELEDGGFIDATEDHPILTQRGWIMVKDLKETDEVVKVNINQIIYDGIKWIKQKNGYYQSTNRSKIRKNWLHQYVYEKEIGPQKKGYSVHHIDHNKDNNNSNNLKQIKNVKHTTMHAREYFHDPKNRQKILDHLDKVRPDHVWPTDPLEREIFRQHLIDGMKNIKPINKICEYCGNSYDVSPLGQSRFCSNKCKSAWRRDSGLDDEKRICIVCGNEFMENKYSRTKTCSRSCGDVLRGKTINDPKYKQSKNKVN